MRARWSELLAVWAHARRRRPSAWPRPLPDREFPRDAIHHPIPPLPVRMALAIYEDIDPHDRFNR